MRRALRNEVALLAGAGALALFLARRDRAARALALGALALRFTPSFRPYSFRGKVALVTGGSRGFGLALAEAFLKAGATVGLLARDAHELGRAHEQLRERYPRGLVHTFVCDVTSAESLARTFREAHRQMRRLDILVNNAGAVVAAPFESTTHGDFEAQVTLHLQAAVTATHLILPYFREQGGGRIANISSIGGKMPLPHMSTYTASKFALAGFSAAVTAELAEQNVHVTTVYPGLMRTGSPLQGVFKGDHELEFAWFLAGDVAPLVSVAPERAARAVLAGIRDAKAEVVISLAAKLGAFVYQNFPETYAEATALGARLLPHGQNSGRKTGAASQGWLQRSALGRFLLARNAAAARRWNQREKRDAAFNLNLPAGEL